MARRDRLRAIQHPVYGGKYAGFGDSIMYINTVRHVFAVTGIRIRFSRWTISEHCDKKLVYRDLLHAFRIPHCCSICDDFPNANIDHLNPSITTRTIAHPIEFLRAPHRWRRPASNIITYQFDGVFEGARKRPTEEEVSELRSAAAGCRFVRLGKDRTIAENLELLRTSRVFLGIDSGLAQLAYTAGVPMVLMRNAHFFAPNHSPHLGRRAVIVADTQHAADLAHEYANGSRVAP